MFLLPGSAITCRAARVSRQSTGSEMESGNGYGAHGKRYKPDQKTDSRLAKGRSNLTILGVRVNNRKRCFEVTTEEKTLVFPFALLPHKIQVENRVTTVYADVELGKEAFTYELESGESGSVHLDTVLYYHADPAYLNDLFLHQMTCEVLAAIEESGLSKRELIRRLGTSASQFYRLLDTTNYTKSPGQLLSLLHLLDKRVEVTVHNRRDLPGIRAGRGPEIKRDATAKMPGTG